MCLEENNYLYAEFEICSIFSKTVLGIFNKYGLVNICKKELLEIISILMKEKSLEYLITTRAKSDSNNYIVVLSIINKI